MMTSDELYYILKGFLCIVGIVAFICLEGPPEEERAADLMPARAVEYVK